MSTLCLSDLGELHDEWLREPRRAPDVNEVATPSGPIPLPVPMYFRGPDAAPAELNGVAA